MKAHLKYDYINIVPDELDYLKQIINIVCDYYFHSNINFYITNDTDIEFNTINNIVFLTGSEKTCRLKDNNFILCFSNFFRNVEDERYIAIPLGVNKFINQIILNHSPISFCERKYDIFFAGYIHPSRLKFKSCIENLKCKKFIHYTNSNNLQKFNNNLSPNEYLEILKNSKIVMAPIGAYHISSYRYFESKYFSNIVFSEKMDNQIIFNTNQLVNQYDVDDWSKISDFNIQYAINNYDSKISRESYQSIFSKFSVSKFIINKINCQIENSKNN